MTRIVTTHYRYKPPPRKRKTAPLVGPAVVTPKRVLLPSDAKKLEPASAIVRKVTPCNDNRPEIEPELRATAGKKSAIITARPKRRIGDGPPPPMELPLSRQPAERDGDDYKRLKAAMARRLRGDDE